jgi:hypothetical protein
MNGGRLDLGRRAANGGFEKREGGTKILRVLTC